MKQDQMEEDLDEYPGLHTKECIEEMGRKVSKSMAEHKKWLKTEKSGSLSPRTPDTN